MPIRLKRGKTLFFRLLRLFGLCGVFGLFGLCGVFGLFGLPLYAQARVIWTSRQGPATACVILNQTEIVVDKAANPAAQELWMYLHLPERPAHDAPLVLILPILGGQNLWIERQFAQALNERGLAAAIVIFPQQFERRYFLSLPSGWLFLDRDPKRIAMNFRQALNDLRFILDWADEGGLETVEPQWKPKKIGVLGISLGAIVGSIAMARDERFAAGAFLLGGADPARLIMESHETNKIAKKLKVSYQELTQRLDGLDLGALAREKGPGNLWKGRPLLIVHAVWDKVIPKACRDRLDQAMPHARVKKLWAGHFSAILRIGSIKKETANFFAENLK
ncbi:MAG: hypothetical protein AAB091_05860 [Elusimicrobiota bacterium]